MSIKEPKLLTRDEFREGVLARDGGKCVVCGKLAHDAHHIIERRLFSDGGYYLDNGASVCATHHILAEQTLLTPTELRNAAGITRIILPEHLYDDTEYDKWGNVVLPNKQRLRGDLFDDESVQKILQSGNVLHLFSKRIKYPRTFHLPWSPGIKKDDRAWENCSAFEGKEVVITEKMDGENSSLYNDYFHARSLDFETHPSRHWAKAIWGRIAHDIPEDFRLCCENVYAVHSIEYWELEGYLLLFSVWNGTLCLSWQDTVEWAALFDLPLTPVLWRGTWNETHTKELAEHIVKNGGEGIVVRIVDSFHYSQFKKSVAKYVRKDHVQTHAFWMKHVNPNHLKVK